MFDEPFSQVERLFGISPSQYQYSSSNGQFPFGLNDVAFATPLELAKRFVQERREIAFAGWGPDAAYAQWFSDVMESTKPNGLYYAFAEYQQPTNYLYTQMTRIKQVPLPPPGWAKKEDFAKHDKQTE